MNIAILFAWSIMSLLSVGCHSNSGKTEINNVKEKEQIEKAFKEGNLSSEEYGKNMLEIGKRDLERAYSEGEIEERKYRTRKATIYMESIYQDLAHSPSEDHIQRALKIAEESQLAIADLLIFRPDGTVSMSINKEQVGAHINSIDSSVHLDKEGRLVVESNSDGENVQSGEQQRRMGVVRPLFNHKACYACHLESIRVLGTLYVMFNADSW